MVSFTCNRCQDVVKKPKVLSHAQSCGTQSYSCVDCMEVFDLDRIKGHNTCISEEEKYQGRWKAKNYGGTTAKKGQPIVDSDNEDEEEKLRKEKALLQLRVRPSAKNFLASSDSDSDDDWLASSKGSKKPGKPSTAAPSGTPNRTEKTKKTAVSPAAAAAADAVAPKRQRGSGAAATEDSEEAEPPRKLKKHSPLILPQSTAALEEGEEEVDGGKAAKSALANGTHKGKKTTTGDVTVEAFVLGSQSEVQEIIQDILDGGAMSEKAVAKELAERYRNRIAKHLRGAVSAAVAGSGGALRMDTKGNITG